MKMSLQTGVISDTPSREKPEKIELILQYLSEQNVKNYSKCLSGDLDQFNYVQHMAVVFDVIHKPIVFVWYHLVLRLLRTYL